MGQVISVINLKGGVGKTTTTVAVAEMLAGEYGKRVLVIDLDPQTNATTMLIGEDRWAELNAHKCTLATLFADALLPPAHQSFDLNKTLQHNVSPIESIRGLDLIPSSLDLIDVQHHLGAMSSGASFSATATDILVKSIGPVTDRYDYVLIDCPPNLGIITYNGLRMSAGYIIPVIPDILSTYGIPQISARVARFASDVGMTLFPFGIVVTKYRIQSTVHEITLRRLLADRRMPHVFNTIIPESNKIAESAEYSPVGTLRQKYGSGKTGVFDHYYALAGEIVRAVG